MDHPVWAWRGKHAHILTSQENHFYQNLARTRWPALAERRVSFSLTHERKAVRLGMSMSLVLVVAPYISVQSVWLYVHCLHCSNVVFLSLHYFSRTLHICKSESTGALGGILVHASACDRCGLFVASIQSGLQQRPRNCAIRAKAGNVVCGMFSFYSLPYR